MSNIDLVLLGLIKQKSQSAYDIKKNIEYRNIPRWVKISEQSIYKKVLQLESKEYIVSHKEKEGNMPDKAVYTITDKGNDYFNKLMNDISNSDVSLYLDFNIIITNLDLVLLGLIKQKSQSAYDIKKNIEYRNIPRWVKISEQSIYKKVLQLESKEYIVSHKEKEGNMPDKAIYTITNKGNDYFNKLMNDISNSDVSLYLDFNIIITNLDLVDDEQKKILVSNIKSKILELKELLNERRSHRQHIPNVGKQMFKQQLALVETLEKWIIDFENSLKEQN